MKRALRLLIICLPVACATTGARANVPADAVASCEAAYKDFETLAKQTRAKGAMPRWSVPADRAVLQKMLDARALLGTPPYGADDFAPTPKLLAKELALLKEYLSFSPDAAPGNPDKNILAFQDETSRISAMLVRIDAVYVPAIAKYVGRLKPETMATLRRGLKRLGDGFLKELTGVSAMILSPAMNADNRALLVDAVADSAESIAAGVTPADRAAIAAKLEPTLPALTPDETTKMQGALKAMANTGCTGLCALEQ